MSDTVDSRPSRSNSSRAASESKGRARQRPASDWSGDILGLVTAVRGSRAEMMLGTAGEPQIGELVRVETALGAGYAIIASLKAELAAPGEGDAGRRMAEIELVGEAAITASGGLGPFRRGLSAYPTLGARVLRAVKEDLARAYRLSETEACVTIGALHQDPTLPATIKIDDMLGKHFAILGATGTGKSCTVALILQSILETYPNAHALLLDAHGEYAPAFAGRAEIITHKDLRLPFWLLTHEELSEVLMGERDDCEPEIELLGDLVRQAKAIYAADPTGASAEHASRRHRRVADIAGFSTDTPSPFRIADLLRLIDDRMGSLEHQAAIATHRRLRGRIDARLRDQRYDFMFGSDAAEVELADVLSRLFRLPVEGRPLAILELSGMPSEVLSVIISVTARIAFDFAIRSDGAAPISLICEEAHKYIPAESGSGFQPTRRAIARIAKEGRKYGVCLGIVSQRPSELDPTILSQCNTVFSMRLSNENDQQLVRSAVSDAAGGLMRFLPALATGEAIAFGDGVSLPMRLAFKRLPAERLPGGATPLFSEGWTEDASDRDYVADVVAKWRRNEPIDRRAGELTRPSTRDTEKESTESVQDAVDETSGGQKGQGLAALARAERGWGRPEKVDG